MTKGWGFVHGASDKPCNLISITAPDGGKWFLVRNQSLAGFIRFISNAIAKNNWGASFSPVLKACKAFGVDAMTFQIEAGNISRAKANDLRKLLKA